MNHLVPIAKPPWSRLGKKLESSCRKALFDFRMLEGAEKVAIALSGGKDSLSLLYLLKAIQGRGFHNFSLSALHVSGSFSCGAGLQTAFLKAICKELEVPFFERHSDRRLEDLECYSCSRERRKLLFSMAQEEKITHIAFGHHRDDNIQTLLMNLLHKAEFAGNLPKLYMHKFGLTLIRPLIYVSESDISHFAEQQSFKRITCKCPVGVNSKRKQTDKLIHEIEKLFPNVRSNLSKAMHLYGSDKAARE